MKDRKIISLYEEDENREGVNLDKIGFALKLPFKPSLTKTLFDLERFEDLDVESLRNKTHGLVLDVDGTLVPHHSNDFQPTVVKKLYEIRQAFKVCVFSNNADEREIFKGLKIPVVKHAAPKPHPAGFHRAAYYYLGLPPEKCTMLGDNPLTDGGARQTGMQFILVDPIPGKEGLSHKLTRSYGRTVKKLHDRIFRRKPDAA